MKILNRSNLVAAVLAALVVCAPAPAAAQWEEFPAVVIRGTTSDALTVIGGGVFGTISDPSGALVDILATADGTGVGGGIRISRTGNSSYLIINADDDAGAGVGFIQSGDSGAYRPLRLNPLGGGVLFGDGTVSAPGVSFVSDPDSGLYAASGDLYLSRNGSPVVRWFTSAGASMTSLVDGAFGTGAVTGAALFVGKNTSGVGAPGCVGLQVKGSSNTHSLWIDSTGVLRTTSGLGVAACPTENGGDTIGTVVGTQTSTRASKAIAGEVTNTAAAMAVIRSTPVYQFTYRNGAYNGETFFGIVTDESPLFGMDRGKSFNPVTAFGATVLALRDLDARVAALEARR